MNITSITAQDLPSIAHLQPGGWLPIVPYYEFYLSSGYCHPLKYVIDGRLAGIGASIAHKDTAWLAHIIVDRHFRNQGIGTAITQALIDFLKKSGTKTILLVATSQGEPIYRKLGFQKETEYVFMKDGKLPPHKSPFVQPFQSVYAPAMMALDRHVSGEDRKTLLEPHLRAARIIVQNNELMGCYLPTLGEGLILAHTPEAGIELMQVKHNEGPYTAIPQGNKAGIDFLLDHGYKDFRRGIRMWAGEEISWRPDKLYGRVGGNLG